MQKFFRSRIRVSATPQVTRIQPTAVSMLAFGILVTTSISSIVAGVLILRRPFLNSDQMVELADGIDGTDVSGNGAVGATVPTFARYRPYVKL
jgi:hypothetical protein